MFCSEWALVKINFRTATVLPLKCKCWHCDECRPGRTRRLVEDAKAGAPTLFITLTSKRRADLTPSQAAVHLAHAWRQLRREYVREHGKGSLAFLAVFEATKKGWPHLHIVARCKWLDQKWLSARMAALHNSPVVDVRRVHSQSKVTAYVSKYVGKNPHRFTGVKRYWRSLDYFFPVAEKPYDTYDDCPFWHVEHSRWEHVADDFQDQGFIVIDFTGSERAQWRRPRV